MVVSYVVAGVSLSMCGEFVVLSPHSHRRETTALAECDQVQTLGSHQ